MKFSPIPEMISDKKMNFIDEQNVRVSLCSQSKFRYIYPFQKPFIIVDAFAKKTTKAEEIKGIELEELKKMGYVITSIPAGNKKWYTHQRMIYRLESKSNITPGARKLGSTPRDHKILKDVTNNRIRLIGPNAWPRPEDGRGWIEI